MFTSLSTVHPRELELVSVYTTVVNPKIASKLIKALNSIDDLPLSHIKRIRKTSSDKGTDYI